MNWEELVGKKVINKETGKIARVISYADRPSVDIKYNEERCSLCLDENRCGFAVDSPLAKEWKPYKEPKEQTIPVDVAYMHGCTYYLINPENKYQEMSHDRWFNIFSCTASYVYRRQLELVDVKDISELKVGDLVRFSDTDWMAENKENNYGLRLIKEINSFGAITMKYWSDNDDFTRVCGLYAWTHWQVARPLDCRDKQ